MDEDDFDELNDLDNGQMRADGMEDTTQSMVNAGKDGISRAGGYAKDKAYDAYQKRKIKDKARTLPPGKRLKANALKAKGNKDKAMGTAKEGVGRGMQGVGKATKASADAAKVATDVAAAAANLALPGSGEAIKATAKPILDAVKNAGKNIDEAGKEVAKSGKEQKAAGKDSLERAKGIETTGHDKGASVNPKNVEIPKNMKIPDKIDVKSIVKMGKKKIDPTIIIVGAAVLLFLVIAILFVVLLLASEQNDGEYKEGDKSNVPYVVSSTYLQNLTITLNENGEYEFQCMDDNGETLTTDEALNLILKTLKENDCKAYDLLGETEKERKDFLKLLIQAEVATQYPDISGGEYKNEIKEKNNSLVVGDRLSSNIQLSRKSEDGKTVELKYLDETSFNKMISEKDEDVMNYYTLKKNITGVSSGELVSLTGGEAMEQMWNFLIDTGLSESGAAGLMGNFQAESACQSVRVQNTSYENSIIYTQKVDSGEISEYDFVHNGPGGGGYGLAQWTTTGRKQNLYTYAKSRGKSIGDLQMQLEFAEQEIQTAYPAIWNLLCTSNNAVSVCDVILEKYEIPTIFNYGDRRAAANQIYATYKGTRVPGSSSTNNSSNKGNNKKQGNTNSNSQANTNSNSQANANSNSQANTNSNNQADANSNSQANSNKSDDNSEDKNSDNEDSDKKSAQNNVASFDKFLFIGDSRYVGIKEQLNALGSNINVCAVEGSSPSQWLSIVGSGSGTVIGTPITLPAEGSVSNVAVMLGVNNVSEGSVLEELLEKLHIRYPKATICYTSTYHIGTKYTGSVKNVDIDTLNGTIREYSEGKSWLRYVDTNEGLHDENGNLKYSEDGLHLTSMEGKNILVNNIKNGISGSGITQNQDGGCTNGQSTYGLVVANRSIRNTYTVESYDEFIGSEILSTVSGTTGIGTRFSETPENKVVENETSITYTPTCVDYQQALKEHTLYFDFLWALYIDTKDKTFVENLAKIAIESSIDVTVFNNETTTVNVTTEDKMPHKEYLQDETTVYMDSYKTVSTTTITTTTLTSKLGVTKADTWLMECSNDANTYSEYQQKLEESIREKTEYSDEIMKLLRKDSERLKRMYKGIYRIERMLENNEKVSFMIDIYEYVVDKALNPKSSKYESISDIMDAKAFDLSTFTASRKKGSGHGSLGGEELEVSGEGYNSIFKVGTRTYINYKQGQGPWVNEPLAGYELTGTLGPDGCAINSIAVILSGYGINMTPKEVNDYAKSTITPKCHDKTLGALLQKQVDQYTSGNMPELVLEQLNSGKPCLVRTNAYSPSHYFCILAISNDGNSVYVSDVAGWPKNLERDGWQPTEVILNRVTEVFIIGD